MVTRNRPLLPMSTLNILLRFPFIYRMKFVNYESGLRDNHGLEDLTQQLESVLRVQGNIIECGSDRCGTSVIMAKYLKSIGNDKKIYALDVFGSGFEVNELEEESRLGLTQVPNKTFRYNSFEYVKNKIKLLGLEDVIIPVKGLFRDTLPSIDSTFCLCLIDCDLRKSMLYCAETLWPKLSRNGVMLFDDCGSMDHKNVIIAVDGFVNEHQHEVSEYGFLNKIYQARKK
jgi:Macrocin-O-methyltransferase (TylF)